MHTINWGIIGCGDVTEIKSGPAFNKVPNSKLVAVMRRDAAKAKDYASRHNVPRWYDDANLLIADTEVNAIYVATPPDSHEAYSIAALNAGKSVYVEKPTALNYAAACNMNDVAKKLNIKLTVAHYRREQPLFKKIKQLLDDKVIGEVRLARLKFYKPAMSKDELALPKNAWRVDPAIAGGGLFHDLAPHQLDMMYHFFGEAETINGIAVNQAGNYNANDLVAGNILFKNGIAFSGAWCFNTAEESDRCEIIGSAGKIKFSFFNSNTIELTVSDSTNNFKFEPLQHVQQPMIERTVQYFLNEANNPCSAEEGVEVMRWLEGIENKK